MSRQAFQQDGDENQQDGVGACQQWLNVILHHCKPSTVSVISATRRASGSSSVVTETVCRMPSQVKYSNGKIPPIMKTASPGNRIHSMNAFTGFPRNFSVRASKYP